MKFKNYLMLRIRVKSLLLLNTIIIGTLCVCFTTLNGDEVEDRKDAVEMGKKYRSPYTLPAGVGFVENEKDKKKEESFYSNEWKEGEVANSVNGIFQSGKNTMASINGIWIKEGDQAGEEYVLEIRRDAVVLMGKGKEKRELPVQETVTNLKVIKKVRPKFTVPAKKPGKGGVRGGGEDPIFTSARNLALSFAREFQSQTRRKIREKEEK